MDHDKDRNDLRHVATEKEAKHTPPTMKAQPTMAGPGGMGPSGSFASRSTVRQEQARKYAEGVAAAEAKPSDAERPHAEPRMTISERKEGAVFETAAENWRASKDYRNPHVKPAPPSSVLRAALKNASPEQQRLAGFMAEAQARQRRVDEPRPFARMGGAIL